MEECLTLAIQCMLHSANFAAHASHFVVPLIRIQLGTAPSCIWLRCRCSIHANRKKPLIDRVKAPAQLTVPKQLLMHVDIWALCWLALCTRYRKTNFFLLAIHLRNHTGKKSRKPPQIEGSGYAVKSLEAALWAFHHTDSFREGCLLAVNLGDDADTTGAIFGQLAGAFYGAEDLPVSWRQKLAHRDLIESFAQQLWSTSQAA